MDQLSPLDDEFYPEILRGLSVCFDSPFVLNIARTAEKYRRDDFANALNRKQIACKKWLIDALVETWGPRYGDVWVLGGWYGVLGALMFEDPRLEIGHVLCIDMDEDCVPVAQELNRERYAEGRFDTLTADMLELDYAAGRPDLLVNTSCEHLPEPAFDEWFARVPEGTRLVLQSNNYVGEPDHVNCCASLGEFRVRAPLAQVDFAGELELPRYTRYMLMGRR